MGIRTISWPGITRRDGRNPYYLPTLILVGKQRDRYTLVVRYDPPDVIGMDSFQDRSILRAELAKRFAGIRCNWFGKPCEIPDGSTFWPDQETAETYTSDGDGPWIEWPRRDNTKQPEADEWRPCQFCGQLICAGWMFVRHGQPNDAACHDHIVKPKRS